MSDLNDMVYALFLDDWDSNGRDPKLFRSLRAAQRHAKIMAGVDGKTITILGMPVMFLAEIDPPKRRKR
jgi:hypothetical protein